MKTSGTKSRSKKSVEVKDPFKRKKIKVSKPVITEDDIREKANEIYLRRIANGEYGTSENDWIEAEKSLRNSDF